MISDAKLQAYRRNYFQDREMCMDAVLNEWIIKNSKKVQL